jgi:hypothetical protein
MTRSPAETKIRFLKNSGIFAIAHEKIATNFIRVHQNEFAL